MTKRKPLFIFARAAMTLLVMLLTTATAWAEDNVPYLDPTAPVGQQSKTQDGVIVINNDNKPEELGTDNQTTWYVVEGSVSYSDALCFSGDVHLILADNAQLIINSSDTGIYTTTSCNLFIYAQSTGNKQGMIIATGGDYPGILVTNIDIFGGIINLYDSGCGIKTASNGSINIYGGTVNASGYNGIITGSITITGGSVTAIGTIYNGITANDGNGSITLNGGIVSASAASDSYIGLKGNVTIGNSLTYTDGTNDYPNNETSLNTLKSVNVWPDVPITYIDENGKERSCSDYFMLTNGTNISSPLGTNNTETWYVIQGRVTYNSDLYFNGNAKIILADNAVVTINNNSTLYTYDDITIYAQSTGSSRGILNIDAYGGSIITYDSKITINGGTINANTVEGYGISTINSNDNTDEEEIIINGGTVTATGYYGIYAADGNITITGGSVSAIGQGDNGIYAHDVTIEDGEINATGSEDGISAYNDIIINGGSINATVYSSIHAGGNITITNGSVRAIGQGYYGIYANYVTIEDGEINATGSEDGIHAYNDISINGGSVTINNQENGEYPEAGIFAYGVITINGGTVISNGSDFGIGSGNGTIILAGATVTASSYSAATVTIANDILYSDGTTTSAFFADLDATKTLTAIMPSTYKLTANLADGNYWSTFYFGSLGFTINEGVDACAYTATYGLNSETNKYELTLHNLGKDIPQGTAVIIVSSTASVNMTSNSNLGTFSGSNDLRGVDVATSLESLKGTYSANALLMLSNKNNHFGFHEVALTNVPARKAFLPIKDPTGARSLNIVFEDGNTTGINAVNRDERMVNSEDAWFDLQGRKIQMPTQRGLYIHNGKKIVVK